MRVDFLCVGMAWVRPWLIALEGEYIRLEEGAILAIANIYVLTILFLSN